MSTELPLTPIQAISSNWWVLLLRGVLLVLVGIYALFAPGISLLAWALVVGCYLIADGIMAIAAGVVGWVESRGWMIVRGVLAILVGGFAAMHPALFGALAGVTVIALLGGWSIAGGILEIVVAIRERKAIEGEGWMILSGFLSILFGIVLFMAPLLSLSLFIRINGAFAIMFGCAAIFLSFKLKKLKAA
ncbi:HdeD family acid-resistance protein [Thalassoglobus polymorphus]|uniref:Acid-resistance membrane protein n=1 Tax=Thalassoglobus polymorphus TaxID=2527994 RepID=A0A517QKV5_9PLAN|nr:DUF308 domain-containing protein [Thalassoglobus polymorphus]QDT32258.1 acid-resistance membrane protein [Thalassoglobus polymorphus]